MLTTLWFLVAAIPEAIAQGKYKVGDRVECDPSQIGQFKPGTVVPYPKNEADRSGRLYYVFLDGSNITEGYVCLATHVRPLSAAPPAPALPTRGRVDQTTAATRTPKFKPGDRVQCDDSQIGAWKPGVVMHYLQTDRYRDANGGYFRVRLDNTRGIAGTFDPGGQVCMANFMRPYNDGYKEKAPNVKRSVGDRLEAQTYAGNWLPARIVAVDGEFFTVRYDNYDSTHDETVDAVRLRTTGTGAPAKTAEAPLAPLQLNGGIPAIPGTAWKMDFGVKGGNVQRILFCRSGRWEVVSSQLLNGGAVSLMGTYKVSGGTLALTGDGRTTNYRISASGEALLLTGGKQDMRLYEPVPTQCK
ncbi:MAG: agenet domain-containing protein [Vicinamibacterales bacterium]